MKEKDNITLCICMNICACYHGHVNMSSSSSRGGLKWSGFGLLKPQKSVSIPSTTQTRTIHQASQNVLASEPSCTAASTPAPASASTTDVTRLGHVWSRNWPVWIEARLRHAWQERPTSPEVTSTAKHWVSWTYETTAVSTNASRPQITTLSDKKQSVDTTVSSKPESRQQTAAINVPQHLQVGQSQGLLGNLARVSDLAQV